MKKLDKALNKFKKKYFNSFSGSALSSNTYFIERECSSFTQQNFEYDSKCQNESFCRTFLQCNEQEKKYLDSSHICDNDKSNQIGGIKHLDSKKKMKKLDETKNEINNEKKKENYYIINIENSKNFYIGSQIVITSKDYIDKNLNQTQYEINDTIKLEKILASKDKLSDSIMRSIAFNFDSRWKNFAVTLGFSEDLLDELEVRFENPTFIIYDILKRYIEQHPNTQLGYIVSVLRDNQQFKALQKLIEIKYGT